MVWWRSGEEGPCIKFVVQILPALAKAEHSEIHTLESQVQKEGSLKKKKKEFYLVTIQMFSLLMELSWIFQCCNGKTGT